MSNTTRRRFLTAGSVALCGSITGCNTNILDNSTSSELGESLKRDGASVTVSDFSVAQSFLYTSEGGYWRPIPLDLRNYAFVHIQATGSKPPAPDEIKLITQKNSETMVGTTTPAVVSPSDSIYERNNPYLPREYYLEGWVAFEFDLFGNTPDDAYIAWGDHEWKIPQTQQEALSGGVPSFDYAQLDLPEQISGGEPLDVELQIQNTGSYSGICRGALHIVQPRPDFVDPRRLAAPIAIDIPASETKEWTHSFNGEFTDSTSSVKFALFTHAGERQFTVNTS